MNTYAYRNSMRELKIYELDQAEMVEDKKRRVRSAGFDLTAAEYIACDLANPEWIEMLQNSAYDCGKISFCSLLGLSYYLSDEAFRRLLCGINAICAAGSEIVFDYQTTEISSVTDTNEKLAHAAGEQMKGKYTCAELEALLQDCGFLIYEHLDSQEMTKQYFAQSDEMTAPDGVAYVLAVKRN